jgi:hypothetical protein
MHSLKIRLMMSRRIRWEEYVALMGRKQKGEETTRKT